MESDDSDEWAKEELPPTRNHATAIGTQKELFESDTLNPPLDDATTYWDAAEKNH
jgi:hypothetical protein